MNTTALFDYRILFSNVNILQISENPEYLKKPADNQKYNHSIQDIFDFAIHRDVIVDNVQKNTCNN